MIKLKVRVTTLQVFHLYTELVAPILDRTEIHSPSPQSVLLGKTALEIRTNISSLRRKKLATPFPVLDANGDVMSVRHWAFLKEC